MVYVTRDRAKCTRVGIRCGKWPLKELLTLASEKDFFAMEDFMLINFILAEGESRPFWETMIPVIPMVLIMYFLVFRGPKKRQNQQKQMQPNRHD